MRLNELSAPSPSATAGGMGKVLLGRLATDRSGSVAIIAALGSLIMFGLAGGAVDYARWVNARNKTQNAVDSAVLAGGRTMQVTQSNETKAKAAALATYRNLKAIDIEDDTISFASTDRGVNFEARGNAYISTTFLRVLGIARLPLFSEAQVTLSEAVWANGANDGTSVEMSVMLDTTGSMAGQKIVDLRTAAAEMVDIVVWSDQSQYTSRMALVPFSSSVNVGDRIASMIDPALVAAGGRATAAKCVLERTGAAELTDAEPGNGAWLTSYNELIGSSTAHCPEDVEIVPLTSDKRRLKAAISDLKAQHSTAGALGTAWAWYMLSPKWARLFGAQSAPASYDLVRQVGPTGAQKLMKIAVLMTDGTYNTYQSSQHSDRSSAAETISGKAVSLCTGMKAQGIVVYTIGFQLDNDLARDTLSACATSPAHFYNATDGDQLRLAFRDIALKSTPLRIAR